MALLLATLWLGAGLADAQVCSIQLEPDTTICQGETVVLEGPPGFPSYQWSNGPATQDITVGSSGTYTLAASYPTGELVTNGNFSGGNNGFTTQFNYNSTLTTDGNYWIGTNSASYHPQFNGTGNGQFMILNSGWPSALWLVWCQDVVVCPEQTYTLSYRARTLSNAQPARLQWWVDGTPVGPEVTLPLFSAGWRTITQSWTTLTGQTGANICLRVMSGDGIGNDIGLDDISLTGTIVLTDEVEVTVTPLPVVDFGPDQALCFGETLELDATVPGGSYLWQDGSTDPTFLVTSAGSYSVEVTANNCSYTEDIEISYNSQLVMELGPDTTLCDGETLVLDATLPGATYLWQDGSTDATFTASGPGTYSVTVFRSGCQVQDALTVNYNPLPLVDLGPDLTRCAGEQATFDATTPGATYLWQDGSTDPTLSASAAGTYSVTITVLGCEASDAVDLAITPLPVVDLGPDQTVCPGTDVVLDATSPGATYTWQDGSTTATFTATQPGTFTVDVVASGCTTSTSASVSNYTLPVVNLGPDVTICAGQSATFSVNVPTASYAWSTGSVAASITAGSAGTYWVDVTRNGCTVRDSVLLNVTPLPVFDLGTNPSVCPGTTTVLDATTAGATYVWSTGATSPTVNVGPGNYTVQVTVNNCPNTDAISVLAFPAAQVALGNDTTLCPGADLLLDATQSGATYAWNTGANTATLLVQTAGPYSITLTDANGCEAVDAITVDFASPVAIDLGADTVICAGEQLLLDATVPIGSYLWTTGAVGPTLNVVASGTYGVQVTQGNCVVSDAIDVQVLPLPVVDLGADTLLCPGEVLVLDATTAGSTYQWSTGETSPTIQVDLSALYSVIVTNAAGCIGSDDITVVYANPGSLDLGPDTAFCAGGAVLLDATLPGAGYTWNGGSTAPTLLVSTSGTYWVDVQQGACTVSDTVVVTVLPAPQLDLGPDAAICAGEDLTLTAAWPGASTLWNTGSVATTLVVNSSGTYSAVLDLAGCTATDSITVTVLTTDAVDLGPDTSACAGSPVMLDATTAGASYLWNTGAVSATLDASIGGTYWVTVSQGTCSASDTIVVDILPAPVLDLGNDVTLCDGEEVSLTAAWPGASTLWNTGSSATTLVVNSSGTYSAVLDLAGCTTTDSITVVVLTADAVDLGPDTAICAGDMLQLDATTAGSTYSWSDGSTGAFLDVTTAGTYWVEVSQAGCSASDTIAVLVNDPGTMDLGPDTTLCAGEELVLDATLASATYLWNDGSTDAIRTVAVAGTYSVEASVGQCVVFDTIAIAVSALPVVDLGADADICPGSSASFDATQQNATYLWHTGSTEATFTTSAAGTVSVTVTVDGCSAADAAEVTLLQGPQPALGADTILCVGASLGLDVSEPGATYLWDDGTTSGVRTITAQGTFWVRVELNTCTASDTLRVDLFDPSSLDLGADLALCAGESATLSTGTTGTTQVWNTGETGTSITVSQAGTYWVEVQVAGCAVADTAIVSVVDLVAPDLGPDRSICSDEQAVLSVSPGAASVLWSTGSTDATLTATAAGTYGVTLSLDGCSATDDVVVDVTERIDELPLASEATLCPGSTLLLDAGTIANASYLWSTGDDGQAILVTSPGTYSVVVTGTCVNASASVDVLPGECMPFIFIPNAFTPNNDGINDVFLPSVNGPITRARLDVFDRWGELIFSTENIAAGWNGESNGTAVQDAVYSWTLTYKAVTSEGVQQEFLTGHVTLLR